MKQVLDFISNNYLIIIGVLIGVVIALLLLVYYLSKHYEEPEETTKVESENLITETEEQKEVVLENEVKNKTTEETEEQKEENEEVEDVSEENEETEENEISVKLIAEPTKQTKTQKTTKGTETKKDKKVEGKAPEIVNENKGIVYYVKYDHEIEQWLVIKDGAERASKRTPTKAEAEKVARDLAKKAKGTVVVYRKNAVNPEEE